MQWHNILYVQLPFMTIGILYYVETSVSAVQEGGKSLNHVLHEPHFYRASNLLRRGGRGQGHGKPKPAAIFHTRTFRPDEQRLQLGLAEVVVEVSCLENFLNLSED